jgi:hypothetical protein
MQIANSVKDTRNASKARMLESYFLKQAWEFGNNDLAKEMGIHPSALSRDKNRIARLASLMIIQLGVPEWLPEYLNKNQAEAVDDEYSVVINRDDAKRLIAALEHLRYPKRKAPVVRPTEASEMQLEMTI